MIQENESPLVRHFGAYSNFDPRYYDFFNVKRGLRNQDGTGVVAGLTSIANVHGFLTDEGVQVPDEGRLTLRGYNITDLVDAVVAEDRPGFEELTYLLWAGDLPKSEELDFFNTSLDEWRDLPQNFVNTFLMNNPSKSVMNMMARSVLMLYANDPLTDEQMSTPEHEIETATQLLSRLPRIAVLSYLACARDYGKPMFINPPKRGLSTAETIFYMLRSDCSWTKKEAQMLDTMLMLHAEHGGGNNSTFTTRCLTSSGTDPYSAYAGGICSLKGPRHGGANIRTDAMFRDLVNQVNDYTDEGQVADYLRRIVKKEAFDNTGLIYGMGHAVYTLSDPRAVLCKKYAQDLVQGSELEAQFNLIATVEALAPHIFQELKHSSKAICANIDMYSGLVYRALGIPRELFTPIFACARMAGWAAHRFEEITEGRRIMRPAYKATNLTRAYVPMAQRKNVVQKEVARDIDSVNIFHND